MGKSIIDPMATRCFLCQKRKSLEVHHIFHGTARRRLADEDGLMVHICRDCHRKLHELPGGEMEKRLQEFGEEHWMFYYDKTKEDFIRRYGKNYIL